MDNNNYTPTQPAPQTPPPVAQQPQQPQQPMYAQPPYGQGQPGYTQNPYPPQPPRASIIQRLYGKSDNILGSLLTWVSVVLFILAPVAILMGLILSVVSAAGSYGGFSGTVFLSTLISAVSRAAIYIFMGSMLAFAKNRLDGK